MFNIYRMLFFSFEEGQNGRNHSSHPRPNTKFSLAKFPILPHWGRILCPYPLILFGRHIIIVCNFPQFWMVNPAIEALNYRPRLAFSGLTTFQSNLKDSASSLSGCLAVIRSILTRLFLANFVTKLLPDNLQVKNVKTQWLTLGNSGCPLYNSPRFVIGQPNNRQTSYSFQVTKQQKSR